MYVKQPTMNINPSAVSELTASLQANLNGQVDHFPTQNDNVKTANKMTTDNRKERFLLISYKTSAKKGTVNLLQEHCNLMALLFEANPNLELLLQFLDVTPIKTIEEFPKDKQTFKCLVEDEADPCNNKQIVVFNAFSQRRQLDISNSRVRR